MDFTNKQNFHILSALIRTSIENCYVHPVTFQMVYNDLNIDEEPENYEEDLNIFLGSLCWDTVIFSGLTVLKICSKQQGNKDNRGGGCGDLKIPKDQFKWEKECVHGITLRDMTEAVYRMKGSKYDWWYELYGGCVFKIDKNTKTLNISVSFDYGS